MSKGGKSRGRENQFRKRGGGEVEKGERGGEEVAARSGVPAEKTEQSSTSKNTIRNLVKGLIVYASFGIEQL